MTDDKGAGEGPYKAGQRLSPRDVFPLSSREASLVNYGYAAGRKAERERCAKIAEKEVVLDIVSLESGEFYSDSAGSIIAKKLRGGQDGK